MMPPTMEIHQLRYFVALAKTGNFSRAAELCHITQPSLSQQIRKLEKELNRELLLRRRNRTPTRLTEAGELFLEHARRILQEVDSAMDALDALDGDIRGQVTLGVLPTVLPYLATDLCRGFGNAHPSVKLTFIENRTDALLQQARATEVSMAIVEKQPLSEFRELLLFEEEILLCLPGEHPLAKSARIAATTLTNEPVLLLTEEDSLARHLEAFFHGLAIDLNVVFRGPQLESIKALVQAQGGLTFVPKIAINAAEDTSLVYRQLDPKITRTLIAIRPRDVPMSRASVALWEYLARRFAVGGAHAKASGAQ